MNAMKYKAVQTAPHNNMRFECRDEAKGVLGKFDSVDDAEILFEGDSREEMEQRIKQYFYDGRNRITYLCGTDNLVYGIYLHHGEADAQSKQSAQTTLLYCLCFIVTLGLGASAVVLGFHLGRPPVLAMAMIASSASLYLAVVKSGILNEIEGAVVTTVLTILAWILLWRVIIA